MHAHAWWSINHMLPYVYKAKTHVSAYEELFRLNLDAAVLPGMCDVIGMM